MILSRFFFLHRNLRNSILPVLLIILALSIFGCETNRDSENGLEVLAKVGDRIITIDDFIHRSEYAIRPAYCRNNTYIHKKIILNSLIAEKILALEEGDTNDLAENDDFIDYVTGRKEQAMRKIHYYEESYKKVILSEEEIAREIHRSLRRYKISYFSVKDSTLAKRIEQKLFQDTLTFSDLYFQLSGDTSIPSREVIWDKPERQEIYLSLYQETPEENEIIGPLNIDNKQYIFIRIDGWLDSKLLTEKQFHERYKLVSERLKEDKAWSDYKAIVERIMREKRLSFNYDTFKRIYELTAPLYIELEEEKRRFINNSI